MPSRSYPDCRWATFQGCSVARRCQNAWSGGRAVGALASRRRPPEVSLLPRILAWARRAGTWPGCCAQQARPCSGTPRVAAAPFRPSSVGERRPATLEALRRVWIQTVFDRLQLRTFVSCRWGLYTATKSPLPKPPTAR